MDTGAVQGIRDREPRQTARDRPPRARRPGPTAVAADDARDADPEPAAIPADPEPRPRLDVIA